MSRENISVNVNEVNKIMIEIQDIKDELKSIFNKLNDLIDDSRECYSCYSAKTARSRYSLFNDNYKTILDNISTYKNDLQSLKKIYALGFENLSTRIERDSAKFNSINSVKRGE